MLGSRQTKNLKKNKTVNFLHDNTQHEELPELPSEIWLKIFKHAEYKTLKKTAAAVNYSFNELSFEEIFSRTSKEAMSEQKRLLENWALNSSAANVRPARLLKSIKSPDYSAFDRINALSVILKKYQIEFTIPSAVSDALLLDLQCDSDDVILTALATVKTLSATIPDNLAFEFYERIAMLLEKSNNEFIHKSIDDVFFTLFKRLNPEQIIRIYYDVISDMNELYKDNSKILALFTIMPHLGDVQANHLFDCLEKGLNNRNDDISMPSLKFLLFNMLVVKKHFFKIFNLVFEKVINLGDSFDENEATHLFLSGIKPHCKKLDNEDARAVAKIIFNQLGKEYSDSIKSHLIGLLKLFLCRYDNEFSLVVLEIIAKAAPYGKQALHTITEVVSELSDEKADYIINSLMSRLASGGNNVDYSLIQLEYLAKRIDVEKLPLLISLLNKIILHDNKNDMLALSLLLSIMPGLDNKKFNIAFDTVSAYMNTDGFNEKGDGELVLSNFSLMSERLNEKQIESIHALLISIIDDFDYNSEKLLLNSEGLVDLLTIEKINYLLQIIKREVDGTRWQSPTIYNVLSAIGYKLDATQISDLAAYAFSLINNTASQDTKSGFMILSALLSRVEPHDLDGCVLHMLTNQFLIFHQNMSGMTEVLKAISTNTGKLSNDHVKLMVKMFLTDEWVHRRFNRPLFLSIMSGLTPKLPNDDVVKIAIHVMVNISFLYDCNESKDSVNYLLCKTVNLFSKENIKPVLSLISNCSLDSNSKLNLVSYLFVNNKRDWKQLEDTGVEHSNLNYLLTCLCRIHEKVSDIVISERDRNSIFQRQLQDISPKSDISQGAGKLK